MTDHPPKKAGRWGQMRRLEFIDFRLLWEGRVNRADLLDFFGISAPQASLDFASYLEQAPGNAVYDKTVKAYVATDTFTPKFAPDDGLRYLDELLAREMGVIDEAESFIGWAPPMDSVPNPIRLVDKPALIKILRAIQRQEALEINYQSMSGPDPTIRTVAPHALGFDGYRWHVRAYCFRRNQHIDFVLARILSLVPKDLPSTPPYDKLWHTYVQVIIGANPELDEGRRRAIELDYGMQDGQSTLTTRQSQLWYLLQKLGLRNHNPDAKAQQLVLLNQPECQQWLGE